MRPSARAASAKRLTSAFVVLATALLLMSCAEIGRVNSCAWVKPIYIGPGDDLSAQTAGQILSHNIAWMHFCNDNRPPGLSDKDNPPPREP